MWQIQTDTVVTTVTGTSVPTTSNDGGALKRLVYAKLPIANYSAEITRRQTRQVPYVEPVDFDSYSFVIVRVVVIQDQMRVGLKVNAIFAPWAADLDEILTVEALASYVDPEVSWASNSRDSVSHLLLELRAAKLLSVFRYDTDYSERLGVAS